MNSEIKQNSFLEGNILKALLRFALPVLLALFLQALYGAVDLWAVGTFASPADISAVATGSQAMMVLTGFVTGLSMGITVLFGKTIGEGNHEKAGEIFAASIWLMVALSLVATPLLLLSVNPLINLINVPVEAISAAQSYLFICSGGIFFIISYNVISAIFRGVGNSRTPLLFVALASLINMGGDILLIKVLHMGAMGAAIATISAQAASVLLSVWCIKGGGLPFPIYLPKLKPPVKHLKEIIRLGLPIALSDMCNEASYLIMIGFVNALGVIASAGVGVAEKLIVFLLLIPMSYLSSIATFVSQNTGAGLHKRAEKAMWQGMATAFFLGSFISYTLYFHGDILSLLFTSDSEVIADSALFLTATALECLILSIAFCFIGYFNGRGKTNFVMLQSICSIFIIKIPYGYFALHYLDNKLFQIGLSTVWGALFTLSACGLYYIYLQRKDKAASGRELFMN